MIATRCRRWRRRVTAEDFSRVYSPNVLDTLQQRIPGVITTDVQGNGFFQDLRYRGFAASPLQGTPQGLAVYMQGIRINEAFGDTVNWDLIPTVAIGRADIWTNNPAFGLNALGGAVSLQMKDGFNYNGFEFDASGGSYGRVGGSMQYGVRSGEWGLYLAAEGFKDDGWRYQSPSRLARFYGDLGWRGTDAEVHFITSVADNYFGVVGPTPIELLNNDYRAIYTWPQTTKNQAQLLAMNGRYSVSDHWTVQSNLYLPQVPAGARRRQRCRGRALQRAGSQSAVQYAVPGGRRISDDSRRRTFKSSTRTIGPSIVHRDRAIPAPPHLGARSTAPGPTRSRQAPRCRASTTTRCSATTTISPSVAASTAARSASKATASSATSILISSSAPTLRCRGPDRSSTPPAIIGFAPVSLAAWNTYYGIYVNDTFDITNRSVGDCRRTLQHRHRSPWPICSAPVPTSAPSTRSSGSIRWWASPTRSCRS